MRKLFLYAFCCSVQILFEVFLVLIHIWRFTLDMPSKMGASLSMMCPLFLCISN
jgi:hypothetical protein